MITLMNDYLRQDCPNEVKIQVIQTMSILVQNIKSETTLSMFRLLIWYINRLYIKWKSYK